jgi:DNA-binding transcriptional regulator YdaS (Cro superfamily)
MDDLKIYLQSHSQAHLGRLMGISQRAVGKWLQAGKVPAERVVELESVTGIPRERLRPDLYRTAQKLKASRSTSSCSAA